MGPFQLGMMLIATFFIAMTSAQELPEPGKLYVIQSTMDGGILYPRGEGRICQRLSTISFGYQPYAERPYDERQKWRVSISSLNQRIRIHSFLSDENLSINELTYDDYPPFCYLIYRELELNATQSGFILRNPNDNKCLYSYGSEVGFTVWRDCDLPYTQSFRFIETE